MIFGSPNTMRIPGLSMLGLLCMTTVSIAETADWSGFYVGINGGYALSNANTRVLPLPEPAQLPPGNGSIQSASLLVPMSGGTAGGQAGYTWQLPAFPDIYIGVETDLNWSSLQGSATGDAVGNDVEHREVFNNVLSTRQKLTWFGSLRGRLGMSPISNVLLYGTGGLAYGSMNERANTNFIPGGFGNEQYPSSLRSTRAGWTAGGGAEWAPRQNWSVKLEYLYVNPGTVSSTVDPLTPNTPFKQNIPGLIPLKLFAWGLIIIFYATINSKNNPAFNGRVE